MPDVGVPGSAVNPLRGTSHTGSQQWQSFEMRMRQRRAERCRVRAEAAIDAGLCEEARVALEEARRLQPELPHLAATEARLADAERPKAPGTKGGAGARGAVFVVTAAAAVGLTAWLLMTGDTAQPTRVPPLTAAGTTAPSRVDVERAREQMPPQEKAALAEAAPASLEAAQSIGSLPAGAGAQPSSVAEQPVADRSLSAGTAAPPTPTDSELPSIDVPPPAAQAPRRELSPVGLPASPVDASPVPPASTALPPPSTPAPAATPPALTATSSTQPAPNTSASAALDAAARSRPQPEAETRALEPAAPIGSPPNADVQIRAALARYERAYSELDVAAARAVWPTVNAAALGRAFENLDSQRVSLGACSIAAADSRKAARVDCTGTATWTPKVGGGVRTEPRRWTFELQAAGDQWQIVRATTR